jgi:hypothetical protein
MAHLTWLMKLFVVLSGALFWASTLSAQVLHEKRDAFQAALLERTPERTLLENAQSITI